MEKRSLRLKTEEVLIFAKCPNCDKHGNGSKQGAYLGQSFRLRQWKREPTCENCGTALVELFRTVSPDA